MADEMPPPPLRAFTLMDIFDDDDLTAVLQATAASTFISSYALQLSMNRKKGHQPGVFIENYVEEVVWRYSNAQFHSHFRMSTAAFEELLEWIAPSLPKTRTVSPEKYLLSTLWFLGNTETYRGVADRFGLSKGCLHRVVSTVCGALVDRQQDWIQWPSTTLEMERLAAGFEERCDFPGVIAAVDGTHIEIPGPCAFRDAYINRCGYPSMQLQVTCSKELLFLDVFTGWPGSVHDARIFKNSPLGEKLAAEGLPSAYHIIGDSAYPLTEYLMVPFRNNGHLDAVQKTFNQKHSSTRVDVERAIGLLKGKWRKLKYLDMRDVEYMPEVIICACVLHNFVMLKQGVDDNEIVELPSVDEDPDRGHHPCTAQDKRLAIAHQIL